MKFDCECLCCLKGKGTFYYDNGDRYEGEFIKDLRHGIGTMHYANGDCYEGDWKYNKKTGRGRLIKPDGSLFEGWWLFDKKEGAGHHQDLQSNKLFVGEWANNLPKCGFFVDPDQIEQVECQSSDSISKKIELSTDFPILKLCDSDQVLINQITDVRQQRFLIRSLGNISDISKLFQQKEKIDKIVDIFQKIAKPFKRNASDDYRFNRFICGYTTLKQITFDDFELATKFIAHQYDSFLNQCLYELGIKSSHADHDTLVITLLEYAMLVFLLFK